MADAKAPVTQKAKVEMGVDWEHAQVIIQSTVEGEAKATVIAIPAEAFVQMGVSVGMTMIQKLEAMKKANKPDIAVIGSLPPGMRH